MYVVQVELVENLQNEQAQQRVELYDNFLEREQEDVLQQEDDCFGDSHPTRLELCTSPTLVKTCTTQIDITPRIT